VWYEGSFFEAVPTGGDLYVLKMIIHDWPDDQAIEILRNVRAAAEVGTTLLLIETVIPDHNRDPRRELDKSGNAADERWPRTHGRGVSRSASTAPGFR